MPLPKNRSRSLKRKMKKRGRILYKRKKQTKVSCAICSHIVKKQQSDSPVRLARKFGSTLCSRCARLVISYAERIKQGTMPLDTLNLSYQKYVSQLLK